MQEYRVNFGNGQVHYAGSREACERFIRDHGGAYSFLQKRNENGDWMHKRNNQWTATY